LVPVVGRDSIEFEFRIEFAIAVVKEAVVNEVDPSAANSLYSAKYGVQ